MAALLLSSASSTAAPSIFASADFYSKGDYEFTFEGGNGHDDIALTANGSKLVLNGKAVDPAAIRWRGLNDDGDLRPIAPPFSKSIGWDRISTLRIYGKDGRDRIVVAPGEHPTYTPRLQIYAGAGSDTVRTPDSRGSVEFTVIHGGAGNDLIAGGPGAEMINGGPGKDEIRSFEGSDWVDGNAGRDRLLTGPGNDEVQGDGGDDLLVGGSGADTLGDNPGNDVLKGGPGRDVLCPGKGNDRLFGGSGPDYLVGAEGHDFLDGGSGNNDVFQDMNQYGRRC